MLKKRTAKRKKIATSCDTYRLLLFGIIAIICLYVVKEYQYSTQKIELDIGQYNGEPYVTVNNNIPFFEEEDFQASAFENYSELDKWGRCGVAYACVSKKLMPTEERGEIGMIKPAGWHTVKYPGIIEDLYLYNRCHLIAWCLTGENANEKNLITGTRYMNIYGMLPFEEMVANYIDRTNNHVLYRVTPMYEGRNLIANGVLIEAASVEDKGEGISFCVYCYNVQPGIKINYSTGESWVDEIKR